MQESTNFPRLDELPLEQLIGCPECDLLMGRPLLEPGQAAECPRCGFELLALRQQVVGRSLALTLAALLLFFPANLMPIMHLNLLGRLSQDTVWSGVQGLYDSGMQGVALLVFLCSMAVPLLKLLCQLAVLLSIGTGHGRHYGLFLYRTYHHMREWGMLEVYLLGILVAMIKLGDLAELSVGPGLACFIGLLLVQVRLEVIMSPQQIWEALAEQPDARG